MARFYIEKLIVSGGENEPSVVDFQKGLNFIIGPSNTGKSVIIACIDYLFGFEEKKNKPPFHFDKTLGYNCFTLITRTENGTVVFERKLDETKISVSGTDPNFKHGVYSISHSAKNSINDIWLQMLGINEPHKILSSQSGGKNQLTLRAMLHMFFVKQTPISRESSVLLKPDNYYADTASKAILLFLMSGKDAEKEETVEDKKIRAAKRTAVITYIKDTVGRLVEREGNLLKQRTDSGINIQDAINSVRQEIEALQSQISNSVTRSKQLMEDIYAKNGKLAECETISNRFSALRSQYHSDVERLTFIIEGQTNKATLPANKKCPFCDGEIAKRTDLSHIEAARAELSHIRVHLTELQKAERDVGVERVSIQKAISTLESEKESVDTLVSERLMPRITSLHAKLDDYRRAIELSKELEVIQAEERTFNKELTEQETTKDSPEKKYDIIEYYDDEQIWAFEEKLIAILKDCNYEGYTSARLNLRGTFDLEVGGKAKSTIGGGGYCAFLNTIVALALVEYLENKGTYSPGLLVADSPLSQLSEPQIVTQAATKKVGFFNYLLSNGSSEISSDIDNSPFPKQIIIVEHPERLPFSLSDYENAHIIEFTGVKGKNRYGFLNGVYNER